MKNLWTFNHPRNFWQIQPDLSDDVWQNAIAGAFPSLGLNIERPDVDTILALTLGEARFGPDHWRLSLPKRIYYILKPLLPSAFTCALRQLYHPVGKMDCKFHWPVEPHYAEFLWAIIENILYTTPSHKLCMKSLWPQGLRYALVLTHDIETADGQKFVRAVADMEENLGFHSSFNFIPERYAVDMNLIDELRKRGFEVGVHDLKHDGKLFGSHKVFEQRVGRINRYLKEWQATGFRAGLTHRQPEWMQQLDIEYDLSFFDTDPFEPIPGGVMSIWPFFIGRFVELPYTLVQDCTLTSIMQEKSPRIWLEKVNFIEKYHGMALVNSHPDYLRDDHVWKVYKEFLDAMKQRNSYWHGLPSEIAKWWKKRLSSTEDVNEAKIALSEVSLDGDGVKLSPDSTWKSKPQYQNKPARV